MERKEPARRDAGRRNVNPIHTWSPDHVPAPVRRPARSGKGGKFVIKSLFLRKLFDPKPSLWHNSRPKGKDGNE